MTQRRTQLRGSVLASNNPRTVYAFGDRITFGVLDERKIRASPSTANRHPKVLQGSLQRLANNANRGDDASLIAGTLGPMPRMAILRFMRASWIRA